MDNGIAAGRQLGKTTQQISDQLTQSELDLLREKLDLPDKASVVDYLWALQNPQRIPTPSRKTVRFDRENKGRRKGRGRRRGAPAEFVTSPEDTSGVFLGSLMSSDGTSTPFPIPAEE